LFVYKEEQKMTYRLIATDQVGEVEELASNMKLSDALDLLDSCNSTPYHGYLYEVEAG
jgi:hypothetical protein